MSAICCLLSSLGSSLKPGQKLFPPSLPDLTNSAVFETELEMAYSEPVAALRKTLLCIPLSKKGLDLPQRNTETILIFSF